jgi:hypothetical protein
MRQFLFFLLFLLPGLAGFSQTFLIGTVRKRETQETLSSVNIFNKAQRKHRLSDEQGNYTIEAQAGDTVIFSFVGCRADTFRITSTMLAAKFPVLMELRPVSLEAVTVGNLSNYQIDSLERREIYDWIYKQEPQPVVERQRQGDGVGVELNVIPHGSSEVRQRLRLKKRIIKEEEKYYVNFRFSPEYVSHLTHLQSDSLAQFMSQYRPSYDFCRKVVGVDMLVYVSDCIKEFRKEK